MFTILFQLYLILRAQDQCGARTSIYRNRSDSNADYWYFDTRTHINTRESCTGAQYRAKISQMFICRGVHCLTEDDWSCIPQGTLECYQAEHIIPRGNTLVELAGCCNGSVNHCDTLANLIMAYGRWNVALSNGYLGEKAHVYGPYRVKSAYTAIYTNCHGAAPDHFPSDLCVDPPGLSAYHIVIIVVCVVIAIAIIMAMVHYGSQQRMAPDDMDNSDHLNTDDDSVIELSTDSKQ